MERSEKAFGIVKDIADLINFQNRAYIQIGKLLADLRSEKLYRDYASHIRWMGDIAKELKISKSQLYNYERIYNMFGKKLEKMEESIPLLRIVKIIPIIKRGGDAGEWLDKAAHLSYEDFLDEIQIWKGGKSYTECEHEETEEYIRCKKCQKWISKKETSGGMYEVMGHDCEEKATGLHQVRENGESERSPHIQSEV